MRRVVHLLLLVGTVFLGASCESRNGLRERYDAEKEFFEADRALNRLIEDKTSRSAGEVERLLGVFDSLANRFPEERLADRKRYSEEDALWLKRIVWSASLRGAGLSAVAGDRNAAVRRYAAIAERFRDDRELGPPAGYLGARAEEARGNWTAAGERYNYIMEGFFHGRWPADAVDERVMEIPFAMGRVVEFSRGTAALASAMEMGRQFYDWIGVNVPHLDQRSRLRRAETYGMEGKWQEYVSSLRKVLDSLGSEDADLRADVFLDMASAYAEGVSLPDSAYGYCSLIMRDYPAHPAAEKALLLQARIMVGRGQLGEGRRRLELLARGRSGVAASARFELGILYETMGRWEDARGEYNSLRLSFPHSVHNYEGLLRAIKHYMASGDSGAAARAYDDAVKFLKGEAESLEGRGASLVARGFLVDVYLLAGKRSEAARELEGIAAIYEGRASGALALLKAARLLRESGNEEDARKLLARFEELYGEPEEEKPEREAFQ